MKSADVKDNTHIDFDKQYNDKDPEFKVSYGIGISKYKNTFAKSCIRNWSEEVF